MRMQVTCGGGKPVAAVTDQTTTVSVCTSSLGKIFHLRESTVKRKLCISLKMSDAIQKEDIDLFPEEENKT